MSYYRYVSPQHCNGCGSKDLTGPYSLLGCGYWCDECLVRKLEQLPSEVSHD